MITSVSFAYNDPVPAFLKISGDVKYQGLIQVQSELTPACGTWKVIKLDLDLEASVPHGKWFLTAEAITASAVTPDQ